MRLSVIAQQTRSWSTSRTALALAVLGTLIALAASWRPSLWTDEAATISAAQRSLPELAAMAKNVDAVHATYYAAMHLWLAALPADAFALRLPSALAVGASVGLVYVIGRDLGGPRLALAAGLIFMILPRTTWMGIEARPYAFSSLLSIAATAVLLRWLGPKRSARWVLPLYAVLVGAGIAVNIYVALVLVAHGITVLLTARALRPCLTWLAAGTVGVLLATPVVWQAVHQTGQLGSGDLGLATLLRSIVVNQWFLGETPTFTAGRGGGVGLSWKLASVALAGLCWLLVAGGLLGLRSMTPTVRERTGRVARCAVAWIAVPTLVVVAYSLLVSDLYNPRYFTLATGGVALLIGHGIVMVAPYLARARSPLRLSAAGWSAVILVVLALVSAPVYVSQRGEYAKSGTDWAAAARFVEDNRTPSSGVYFAPRFRIVAPTVGATTRGIRVAYPEAFTDLPDVTLARTPVQDNNLIGTSRLLENSRGQLDPLAHVWVVRRHDYACSAQDDRILVDAGFHTDLRWVGPLDEVVRYSRRSG